MLVTDTFFADIDAAMHAVLEQDLLDLAKASLAAQSTASLGATATDKGLGSVPWHAVFEQDVLGIIAKELMLPMEELDRGENLTSYGITSLSVTEMAHAMSHRIGQKVNPAIFYEGKTLNDFLIILQRRFGSALEARYGAAHGGSAQSAPQTAEQDSEPSSVQQFSQAVLELIAKELMLPIESLDREENLTAYGITSLSVTGIAHQLSAKLGKKVNPAVFYEGKTVEDFIGLLVKRFRPQIEHAFALSESSKASKPESARASRSAKTLFSQGVSQRVSQSESRQHTSPNSPQDHSGSGHLVTGAIDNVPPGDVSFAMLMRQLVAKELMLSVDELDADEHLSHYGMTSLSVTGVVHQLNKIAGWKANPAVFYEGKTLNDVTQRLARRFSIDRNQPIAYPSDDSKANPAAEKTSQGQSQSGLPAETSALDMSMDELALALNPPERARESTPSIRDTDSLHKNISEKTSAPGYTGEEVEADSYRLDQDILTIFSSQLKLPINELDTEENITNYGISSIDVMGMVHKIAEKTGLKVNPAVFYESKTLNAFLAILRERFSVQIEQRYGRQNTQSQGGSIKDKRHDGAERPHACTSNDASRTLVLSDKVQARLNVSHELRNHYPDAHRPLTNHQAQREKDATQPETIAIIGMAGQLPNSADLDAFWDNLKNERDCIREVPTSRWDWQSVYGDPNDGLYTRVKWGGFIDNIDEFDEAFFNISRREARLMDPQHRLFIQCAWHLFENAGYNPKGFSGEAVGVFLGINLMDYMENVEHHTHKEPMQLTGTHHTFCPNRLSFLLNVNGPSEVVDTACSSSLVALHRAVAAIHNHDCRMAVVGGSNLMVSPQMHLLYSKLGMLSLEGRCKTFSDCADGYTRSDGVAAVLLKPLGQAEKDGDQIHGVILGSAENHGGAAASLTAPNPAAQANLIIKAHERANIDPRGVSYIECHGTGTALGDPIEIEGLKHAFHTLLKNHEHAAGQFCALGSVKSNIGHTETTAGIAGVIKVLLSMKHQFLPRSLHCERMNASIELNESPFYVLQKAQSWRRPVVNGQSYPRTAGVSAFGAGGTNAHVILQEYTGGAHSETSPPAGPFLFLFSAKTALALEVLIEKMLAYTHTHPEMAQQLYHASYTLAVGREHHKHRCAIIAGSVEELRRQCQNFKIQSTSSRLVHAQVSRSFNTQPHGLAEGETLLIRLHNAYAAGAGLLSSLQSASRLYCEGYNFDWSVMYPGPIKRIQLPNYPFAKNRHWIESQVSKQQHPHDIPGEGTENGKPRHEFEPIAIIGRDGVFPGSPDPEALWKNLLEEKDCISEVPKTRWDWEALYGDPRKGKKTQVKWGGFIDGIEFFDEEFFQMSPREARVLDPQHRMFIQCVWKLIECAGYNPYALSDTSVGMFLGINLMDYMHIVEGTDEHDPVQLTMYNTFAANRLSFMFNFSGPSEVIDTACSSSLVAMHRAITAIHHGDCELAIAGGANLMILPTVHLLYSKVGMLSRHGRCKTFSSDAAGYVRSDGIGAVFLKKLSDAERDRDFIHGVVIGSAENHGGTSASLTAPNSAAQASLVAQAHERAGVDPRSVSYIECHGTGTPLGDPIEIEGLKQAFEQRQKKLNLNSPASNHCALGSVKSNIGHTETAAGMASVIKVLLALQHQFLPRSLHCDTLNPNIELDGSPFYILQQARRWETPNIDGKPVARIAGVSSFGAGGTNSHLLIKEYDQSLIAAESPTQQGEYVFVFSAKTQEALQEYLARYNHFFNNEQPGAAALSRISYTLLSGREHFHYRYAVIASSTRELIDQLDRYRPDAWGSSTYAGYVEKPVRRSEASFPDASEQRSGDTQSPRDLAKAFCRGEPVAWQKLFGRVPYKYPLLSYPFAKNRHWIEPRELAPTKTQKPVLHPLVHENVSDLYTVQFRSQFRGDEFFLRDHVVAGQSMLPGAAYLEMAREAITQAMPETQVDTIHIEDLTWLRPAVISEKNMHLRAQLIAVRENHLEFEIAKDGPQEEASLLCRGTVRIEAAADVHALAFTDVQRRCQGTQLSGQSLYQRYSSSGFEYGPAHKVISHIALNHDHTEALAELRLPDSMKVNFDEYFLHPGLMDGVFQAAIGVLPEDFSGTAVPYALESLQMRRPLAEKSYAWVRSASDSKDAVNQQIDITVYDAHGNTCLDIHGFRLRRITHQPSVQTEPARVYQPRWKPLVELANTAKKITQTEHHIVLLGVDSLDSKLLGQPLGVTPNIKSVSLASDKGSVERVYQKAVDNLYEYLRNCLNDSAQAKFIQVLVVDKYDVCSAVVGLLKSAWREHPYCVTQTLSLPEAGAPQQVVHLLVQGAEAYGVSELALRDGNLLYKDYEPIVALDINRDVPTHSVWQSQGVYLITGGTGGLGRHLCQAMTQQLAAGVIILTSRHPLTDAKEQWLQQLNARTGMTLVHYVLDVTDSEAVASKIQVIEKEYGSLNGILHCAGVLSDGYITQKTPGEWSQVLAPKVQGTVNLDRATRHMSLDWFVCFSSISAVLGNAGQGDYAAANAFMDHYCELRRRAVSEGQAQGITVSINWPLWREGGMQVAPAIARMIEQQGLRSLQTDEGWSLLNALLAAAPDTDLGQATVLAGDSEKIRDMLNTLSTPASAMSDDTPSNAIEVDDAMEDAAIHYFKKQLASVLKVSPNKIQPDAPLENFGIDSILVMELTAHLEKTFGPLSKTLFFEVQNTRALARYFLQHKSDILSRELGQIRPTKTPPRAAENDLGKLRKPRIQRVARPQTVNENDDIVIIGLSGRYPQADGIDAYWHNLKQGVDCISEVPPERWDTRTYFSGDRDKLGKTYSKWGGFLDNVDCFDPLFFGMTPREAELVDPQERLFLQSAYHCIEDAGYTRDTLVGAGQAIRDVGVFVGVMYEEYPMFGLHAQAHEQNVSMSCTTASIANRVSYFCNFHGPSMAVDTMCSSSLSAIHLALQHIREGDCSLALAGGVNTSLHPNKYLALSRGGFVSSMGRCESFGQGGDGYVPGEGVGCVLLKPREQAIADGDHIYAVIKSSAVNHGGKTNGYTVPNPVLQSRVIVRAFEKAGLTPGDVNYIEAHGTGTSLGDPIEITGLATAFKQLDPDYTGTCVLGSAKSNIGHCESAAGIAGLTKVLLQMKHKQLVPSLHSATLNPNIDFSKTPFVVQQELQSWPAPNDREPRRAGISSFGAGGANAHILIEEFTPVERSEVFEGPYIIVLSSTSDAQLLASVQQLRDYIHAQAIADRQLASLAYTLQVGREAFNERLAIVVDSMAELIEQLDQLLAQGTEGSEWTRGCTAQGEETLSLFDDDQDFQTTLVKWVEQGKYDKLIELWVKGLTVPWEALYATTALPGRISLPGYVFAQRRCWVPGADEALAQANTTAQSAPESQVSEPERRLCLMEKIWQLAPLNEDKQTVQAQAVILTSQDTEHLALTLQAELPGSVLHFADAPNAADTFKQIDCVLYDCWIDLLACGHTAELNPYYWLQCLQTFIEADAKPRWILGLTQGLEADQPENRSSEQTQIQPSYAAAIRAPLYAMLQSEYRQLSSRHIDLDSRTDITRDASQLVRQLLAELRIDPAVHVCYRNNLRYQAVMAHHPEEPQWLNASAGKSNLFPADQTLLISGGTRGIGMACAEHFVRHRGVKKIILMGRDPLPEPSLWHQPEQFSASVRKKIAAIQTLQNLGARVRVITPTLNHAQEIRDALAAAVEELGPVGGFLHCAGLVDSENPAFVRKPQATFASIIEPKYFGAEYLLEALREAPLQFAVLFSSVSARVPRLAVGQSDYAMANGSLDYLAQSWSKTQPVISLQWPSWKAVGMGEITTAAYKQAGFLAHTPQEGLSLLDVILDQKARGVLMPAVVNPSLWQPGQLLAHPANAETKPTPSAGPKKDVARVRVSGAGTDLYSAISHWLKKLFGRELKLEPGEIQEKTSIADYGADSILLMQLQRQISKHVEEELDPSLLYEQDSIAQLTQWLLDHYAPVFSRTLLNSPESSLSDTPDIDENKNAKTQASATESDESATQAPSRSVSHSTPWVREQDIAIVGMSCRFPGAQNLEQYWNRLREGASTIAPVSDTRWQHLTDTYASLIENPYAFDYTYFGMARHEAQLMDPQARLLLEECLRLFYHAGYTHTDFKGSHTGVYLGARSQYYPALEALKSHANPIVAAGQNYLAANLSHFFDLHGPSLVVDTACSSALVAMQMAAQALHAGDIDSAVVGGVNIMNSADPIELFAQRGLANRSGQFHVFDARANGVVLGEGVGFVLLKPLSRALADGDTIYASLKGIAMNNDGHTSSPTAPNYKNQQAVMRSALRKSGLRPDEITYVEANGSGAEVTDLLELKAIQRVYRETPLSECRLGSTKPNFGHMLYAQGMASLIKVVLMLHHQQGVPFISGQKGMAHFDFANSPLAFGCSEDSWSISSAVAINAFADGGTNAHAVLRAWSHQESTRSPRQAPALHPEDLDSRVPEKSDKTTGAERAENKMSVHDYMQTLTGADHSAHAFDDDAEAENIWAFEADEA